MLGRRAAASSATRRGCFARHNCAERTHLPLTTPTRAGAWTSECSTTLVSTNESPKSHESVGKHACNEARTGIRHTQRLAGPPASSRCDGNKTPVTPSRCRHLLNASHVARSRDKLQPPTSRTAASGATRTRLSEPVGAFPPLFVDPPAGGTGDKRIQTHCNQRTVACWRNLHKFSAHQMRSNPCATRHPRTHNSIAPVWTRAHQQRLSLHHHSAPIRARRSHSHAAGRRRQRQARCHYLTPARTFATIGAPAPAPTQRITISRTTQRGLGAGNAYIDA